MFLAITQDGKAMKSLVVIGFVLALLISQPADAFCSPRAMGDCESTGAGLPFWLMVLGAFASTGIFLFGIGLKGTVYLIVNVGIFYATGIYFLDRIGGFAFVVAVASVVIANRILQRLIPWKDGE
jgi:hypothetical protein